MKKVLFVATVVKKHINAFHLPYLKWFQDNGYETHVCASNDFENKRDLEIPFCDKYHELSFERSPFKVNNIKGYRKLKKIIEDNDYDIIHCHTPMGGVLTRLAALRARKRGTKLIYTAHGFHFYKGAPILNWLLYYPVERWLAEFTDLLITINKEDYTRAQNFKAKEIVYVPGVGIDAKSFNVQSLNKNEKRIELNISTKEIVLISVGELSKRKNHEAVIKALAKLNNHRIIYLICGVGELDNYLNKLAKELNVNVKFLGFRKDIPELCAVSDMYIFPSIQEGLPVALMEAMSAGLPVMCSNIRGNTDLIEQNKNGLLFDPYDIEEIAKSIDFLLKNISTREIMGKNNRNKIVDFDLENVTREMEILYKEV